MSFWSWLRTRLVAAATVKRRATAPGANWPEGDRIKHVVQEPFQRLFREVVRYGRQMAIRASREVLAGMLREHGEDDLASRALSLSDDALARIQTLGAYYAFSEDAIALGGSMGGSRALSLATIDVLENTGRDLRVSRTEREHGGSAIDRFAEDDIVQDRGLRRHAAERQVPAG